MRQKNNSKLDFICQSCKSIMEVKMIGSNKCFSKKDLLTMMETEDFSVMLESDMSYLDVYCFCSKPQLSIEDKLLLNEIDYWKYADPLLPDLAQPVA